MRRHMQVNASPGRGFGRLSRLWALRFSAVAKLERVSGAIGRLASAPIWMDDH